MTSRWVRAEAAAGEKREVLIPVLLDEVPMPLRFSLLEAAPLINWRGDIHDENYVALLNTLADMLGRPSKDDHDGA